MANEPSALNQDRVSQFIRYLAIMSRPTAFSGLTSADLKALYDANKAMLLAITPQEILAAFSQRLAEGETPDEVLGYLGKIINVLHQGLSRYDWPKPAAGTFLAVLMAENEVLLEMLQQLKELVRPGEWQTRRAALQALLGRLMAFDCHYQKKENILFPYLEKADPRFDGLTIMWTLHDQIRGQLRQLADCVGSGRDDAAFIALAGSLVFSMHGLVTKESLILFPAAAELFSAEEFADMLAQSFDYGFALAEPPKHPADPINTGAGDAFVIDSATGRLSVEEALLIFNTLPVDITFVDENNKVRYFNKARDRFFPRSPAVIGRDVSRCHPAESVHVVMEIIEAFRSGRQDTASFWLELKNRMLLIRYFALRTETGLYRGVLEVSQDVTGIRSLEGQRRLLQWDLP